MTKEATPGTESGIQAEDPLTVLAGIGPARAAAFTEAFGVQRCGDLLRLLPVRYEEPPVRVTAQELPDLAGRLVQVPLQVLARQFWRRGRRSTLRLRLGEEGSEAPAAEALFFNQPYRRDAFEPGELHLWEGRLRAAEEGSAKLPQLLVPRGLALDAPEPGPGPRPLYPETEGLPASVVAKAVRACLPLLGQVEESLPDWLRDQAAVPPLGEALATLHQPTDHASLEAARRRLAWGEVLRREQEHLRALPGDGVRTAVIAPDPAVEARIRARLPFPLSAEQEQVLTTLQEDLARGRPMARLLHGEVGSGKTAVAFALALMVVAAGGQVALLAPTEILARQHLATFRRWLDGSAVLVHGLLGEDQAASRRAVLASLASTRPSIAIGTHALFQDAVRFGDLRLVLFDEQHRFGVRQKAALLAKGSHPHVLTMTATPIPRTLAWARFGAVEVCTLRQRAGTQAAIHTTVAPRGEWRRQAEAWRPALEAGDRAFVVVPHVDGEDGLAAWQERLLGGPWRGLAAEAVHGRMPGSRTAQAVVRFARGAVPLLFGTSVVEVGLDVPAVPRMLICAAERFGLASLHQLRGRLARGPEATTGHCLLLAKDEEACAGLRFLETAADGFAVAEEDLRRRGPGTLRGQAQHGHVRFQAFDPRQDADLLPLVAQEEVRNWLRTQG